MAVEETGLRPLRLTRRRTRRRRRVAQSKVELHVLAEHGDVEAARAALAGDGEARRLWETVDGLPGN
jgi:hypothetical protein